MTDLSAQDFAKTDKVMGVHEEFRKGVGKEVEEWRARLMLYLQDEETVQVLVPPTQVSLATSLASLYTRKRVT